MKPKFAFGILLLTCVAVAGRASCPIAKPLSPVASKTTCVISQVKHQEITTLPNQSCDIDDYELRAEEDKPGSAFKEKPFRSHSPQEQKVLQPAGLTSALDLSFSDPELENYIIIDFRHPEYVFFPRPLPDLSLAAFIRNGILRF